MNTPTEDFGKIIAFYSFKGGTGRSMALANVGCILARQQKMPGPVLMVDWDLEAPGLHRYFRKHLYGAFRGSVELQDKSPGLIDLFVELRDRLDQSGPPVPQDYESAKAMLRDVPVADYIVRTDLPNLHLLKAGSFNEEYAARVATYAWQDVYSKSPFLLRAFAERLAQEYRYVLIDSRTGLTDTSGICAMLLPEILVTVFTPNIQSVTGVVDLIRQAGRYRAESDDLRPLVVYPLPSRIEASEPALRKEWRYGNPKDGIEGFQPAFEAAFTEVYGLDGCSLNAYFDDVQVQHVPRYAYGEETAVLVEETRDRFSLTRSYQRFAKRLSAGQLPWVRGAGEAEDVTEEEMMQLVEDSKVQDRLASSYLQRITKSSDEVAKVAAAATRRFRTTTVITVTLNIITLGLILGGIAFDRSLNSPLLAVLVMVSVAAGALVPFTQNRAIMINGFKRDLGQEIATFKDRLPPYETEDALQRFRDKVEPIIKAALSAADEIKTGSGKIFISFRRDDTAGHAGRLFDELHSHFGPENVFMDIDSVGPGEDFVQVLEEAVASAEVMLVLIGRNWSGMPDRTGRPRLENPSDFVRIEIGAALRRNVRVIPVLVQGAALPAPKELPDSLKDLARRQAVELSDSRWHYDVARLVETLDQSISGRGGGPRLRPTVKGLK